MDIYEAYLPQEGLPASGMITRFKKSVLVLERFKWPHSELDNLFVAIRRLRRINRNTFMKSVLW